MEGLIFGMIDNGVLLLGAFTGLEVEKYLPKRFQKGLGAVAGAGIGNTVSDGLGAALDPSMTHMIVGIVVGCLIPLIVIPVVSHFKEESTI